MKNKFFILLFCVALLFSACGQTPSEDAGAEVLTWQEQYDLGIRYLSEGNYEEAIIAFTAACEIDPKQEAAYIGLADAYVAQGDTEKAVEILQQAIEAVGETDNLSVALEMIVAEAELETENGLKLISLEGYPKTDQSGSLTIEYDEYGRWVKRTRSPDDTWERDERTYNSDGSWMEYSYHYGSVNGQRGKFLTTFFYDREGRLLWEERKDPVERKDRLEYSYAGTTVDISLVHFEPGYGEYPYETTYEMLDASHYVRAAGLGGWSKGGEYAGMYISSIWEYAPEPNAYHNAPTASAYLSSGFSLDAYELSPFRMWNSVRETDYKDDFGKIVEFDYSQYG